MPITINPQQIITVRDSPKNWTETGQSVTVRSIFIPFVVFVKHQFSAVVVSRQYGV